MPILRTQFIIRKETFIFIQCLGSCNVLRWLFCCRSWDNRPVTLVASDLSMDSTEWNAIVSDLSFQNEPVNSSSNGKLSVLVHYVKGDVCVADEWSFYAVQPTSEAINEVHYGVCVKSSHFNEPSMTCYTSNRLTVLFFLAPNFFNSSFWDVETKIKNVRSDVFWCAFLGRCPVSFY